jgi:hypothetical protein
MLKKSLTVLVLPLLLLFGPSKSGSGNSTAPFGQTSSVNRSATGTTNAPAIPGKPVSRDATEAAQSLYGRLSGNVRSK